MFIIIQMVAGIPLEGLRCAKVGEARPRRRLQGYTPDSNPPRALFWVWDINGKTIQCLYCMVCIIVTEGKKNLKPTSVLDKLWQ